MSAFMLLLRPNIQTLLPHIRHNSMGQMIFFGTPGTEWAAASLSPNASSSKANSSHQALPFAVEQSNSRPSSVHGTNSLTRAAASVSEIYERKKRLSLPPRRLKKRPKKQLYIEIPKEARLSRENFGLVTCFFSESKKKKKWRQAIRCRSCFVIQNDI